MKLSPNYPSPKRPPPPPPPLVETNRRDAADSGESDPDPLEADALALAVPEPLLWLIDTA